MEGVSWAELCPAKLSADVLTPSTPEYGCIWRQVVEGVIKIKRHLISGP